MLRFTLHWPAEGRWLGRDYEVAISTGQQTTFAAERPKS